MTALLLLVVVWLGVLVPQAVKARADRERDFLDSFQRQLGALDPSHGLGPVSGADGLGPVSGADEADATRAAPAPPPAAAARRRVAQARRRRAILAGLLVSVVVSLPPVLLVGGRVSLAVHLAVDNCLLAYLCAIVRSRDLRAARTARPLSPAAPAIGEDGERLVLAPRVRPALR
jgi:hypothetical protein